MEAIISAISGEILSRFISFLVKKHTERACVEEKLERLQHLLLRIHTVVEEAEGRYITNSKMLVQLRMLVDAMYQAYYVLDTFRFKPFEEIPNQQQVVTSSALSASLKRTRPVFGSIRTTTSVNNELQAATDKLETVVANMTEFVILLGGCKQMHKRPYDTYLYIDMFNRLVEKQELINGLLQDNSPASSPAVIPVIGGYRVGKKSLVGYACNDNVVRSHFSSVLHLKSSNFGNVSHETFMPVRTLVIIEFVSNMDDSEWLHHVCAGSKIIIISRIQEIVRFGTVKPILLGSLSNAEFSYLFKVLAFGSTDPENYPQLASIAMELSMNVDGLLLVANMLAGLLRKNQNVQFWFHILKRFRNSLERNFSMFGEHPKKLLERDRPTDISLLIPSSSGSLHLLPSREDSSSCKEELPNVKFGDLVEGSLTILPKEEFQIIIWESRIPPFTKFVANCIENRQPCNLSDQKKRKCS
ncbi:hypothetical protein EJB05_23067, partial [Eragrostis curvula]